VFDWALERFSVQVKWIIRARVEERCHQQKRRRIKTRRGIHNGLAKVHDRGAGEGGGFFLVPVTIPRGYRYLEQRTNRLVKVEDSPEAS
jgi:hypothetical protein